jgi:hypothetical protein
MSKQPPEPHSIREWVAIMISLVSIGIVIDDRLDSDRERRAIVECVLHIDQRCKPNPER